MFKVVMKIVQLLPDGHKIKKEVDMALDTVSETMTPMHYHLREIIICTYRQVSNYFTYRCASIRCTQCKKIILLFNSENKHRNLRCPIF